MMFMASLQTPGAARDHQETTTGQSVPKHEVETQLENLGF